ncbi:MAG: efflux RND transporter permease subunit [Synechococcales bacterium]|nr:efflux RND transporter permease subunit [Synechococcales bacterium]
MKNRSGFSLSATAIRQHIGTLMLTLALVVIGVFFIFNLQVDLLPSITYPRIGVRLSTPGVSPEVAVDEVTRPLEEALSAAEGVVQVFSQTREGRVSIDLYFEPGGDIDQALNDATAAFNQARPNLPNTVEAPRLYKYEPSQLPVYELAIASTTLTPQELRVFTDEELARELSVVKGVAAVEVAGGLTEEVQVLVDFNRLQSLGLSLHDVLDELDESNQDVSGGRLRGDLSEPLTRAVGLFQSADEIRNLTFEPFNGGPRRSERSNQQDGESEVASAQGRSRRVYLRDFAQVIDATEEQRIFVNLNGRSAVKVSLLKQPDANTIEVVEAVKQRIQELRDGGVVPDDMQIISTLDESLFIRNAIANVTSAGLLGSGLAAIAVLIFLGSLRQTLIIVLAIPLATLTAIILMKLFGLSLNVFSLGGLALGVGIVVDNSIVMLETIAGDMNLAAGQEGQVRLSHRHLIEQAIQSSQSVESALVASTATNLVAVLPFLLIGGFIALLFNELVLTVSFAVAASILVAVTVVPMLTSRLLTIRRTSGIARLGPLRAFNRRFDAAKLQYTILLERVLRRRVLVILCTFLLLGGSSIAAFGHIPQEILPRIDTGQARLVTQFPPGTTLETNRRVMAAIDTILLEQPETEYAFTTAGGFLFGSSTSENVLRGTSTVTLKPGTDVESYVARVTQEFERLNLVDIRLRMSPGEVRGLELNNSPVRSEIDLVLQGNNAEVLEQAGQQVLKALEEQAILASYRPDADSRQPEIQVRLDRERAADLNLNTQDVGTVIETAISGSVPTQLQRGDRLVDVRVQLDQSAVQRPSQLAELPVFTDDNQLVRLGDIAQIEEGQAPGEIQRINQRQVFIIEGSLNEGASLGDALAEVDQVMAGIDLPDGVSRFPSAAAESNREIQSTLPILGGLAAFLVFVVMAVQYNSLIDPLVIMFTLPLALAGGIWGLFLTQTAIGATVIVGVVLLVGIVVNNAIIMVELANQILARELAASGASARNIRRIAILQAAPQRLRPILMTTITTVVGMFPLALGLGQGGEFLQPLGIVVFSGLALATLLTLFIIPCFYLLLHDLVDAFTPKAAPTAPGRLSAPIQENPTQPISRRQ